MVLRGYSYTKRRMTKGKLDGDAREKVFRNAVVHLIKFQSQCISEPMLIKSYDDKFEKHEREENLKIILSHCTIYKYDKNKVTIN